MIACIVVCACAQFILHLKVYLFLPSQSTFKMPHASLFHHLTILF